MASLLPTRVREFGENHSSNLALWVGLGFFAVYILAACLGAQPLTMMIALGILGCLGIVTLRLPVVACMLWLLLAGTTPEVWFPGILPGSENAVTAVIKVAGLALVGVCILRYGLLIDFFNPGVAFLLMFVIGVAHGLYPALTLGDSLRTLIGSAAPFAFCFSRLSRRWSAGIIEATIWVPTLILVFGAVLAVAGMRPFLFPDEGGSVRLAGTSLPAFLGGFALASVYAALIELYRNGRNRYLYLLVWNLLILFGSGARSPLGCAIVVAGYAFVAIRSESFNLRKRVLPLILALLTLPLMLVIAATSNSVRLLTVLSGGNAEGLSGRDVIWPFFEDAFARSPIFGWGIGTGKLVVDPDSLTAKLLGTTAAHNEYLRMGVEGGYVGIALLMTFMTLWTWRWTSGIMRSDRIILRLAMLCFALQSITDNTLIAPTASVLFTWMSAVFARGRIEIGENRDQIRITAGLDLPARAQHA